jgi:hypothetical protein
VKIQTCLKINHGMESAQTAGVTGAKGSHFCRDRAAGIRDNAGCSIGCHGVSAIDVARTGNVDHDTSITKESS